MINSSKGLNKVELGDLDFILIRKYLPLPSSVLCILVFIRLLELVMTMLILHEYDWREVELDTSWMGCMVRSIEPV